LEIQAKEILKIKELLTHMLAKHTGQSDDRIARDSDRDYFMSAQQALEYGVVDNVIEKHEDAQKDEQKDKSKE
jgi:ATP-dependent Clp protease protease subunit